MIQRLVIVVFLLCISAAITAQQNDINFVPAEPSGGGRAIGLTYHGIGFTNAQRNHFGSRDIKLVFAIDTLGKANLLDVEGVTDASIIDSLKSRRPPEFRPAVLNGKKQNSNQSFYITFPFGRSTGNPTCYGMFDLTEVRQIETWRQVEVALGAMTNFYPGTDNYLRPGGGYRIESVYKPKEKFGVGFAMGMYGNRFKNPYPVEDFVRLRNTALSIYFMALMTHPVYQNGKNEVHVQAELSYIAHHISTSEEENKRNLALNGYAPGILLRYAIQIGKDRLHYEVGRPTTQSHRLEFHGAARRTVFKLEEASSSVVEFGMSYRLIGKMVKYLKMR